MYTFDGRFTRLTFSLILLLAVWFLPACDDTPVVGGNLSPDDVNVDADTLFVDNISVVSSPSFSGNRPFVTAGYVNDPVFGELEATAMIRPSISRQQEDFISDDAQAFIGFEVDHIYGSTSESAEFQIVEIDRRWRSTTWRYDSIPALSDRVVADFTVTDTDSLNIQLPDEWLDKYREIFHNTSSSERDSLYRSDMPGLAIIPAGGSDKLFSIGMVDARLIINNHDEDLDDLEKSFSSWAVSVQTEIDADQDEEGSVTLLNTMGAMLEIDFPVTEEFLGTSNFSRLELVIYEDTLSMDTDIHGDFVRPRSQTSRLYYLEPEDLNLAVAVDPVLQANRRSEDSSHRYNLTNFATDRIHGSSSTRKLYLAYGFNDGRVIPMKFGAADNPEFRPRLLITSISQQQ